MHVLKLHVTFTHAHTQAHMLTHIQSSGRHVYIRALGTHAYTHTHTQPGPTRDTSRVTRQAGPTAPAATSRRQIGDTCRATYRSGDRRPGDSRAASRTGAAPEPRLDRDWAANGASDGAATGPPRSRGAADGTAVEPRQGSSGSRRSKEMGEDNFWKERDRPPRTMSRYDKVDMYSRGQK